MSRPNKKYSKAVWQDKTYLDKALEKVDAWKKRKPVIVGILKKDAINSVEKLTASQEWGKYEKFSFESK